MIVALFVEKGGVYFGIDGIEPWDEALVRRVGKKAAGRLLNGREHNGFPEVRHA